MSAESSVAKLIHEVLVSDGLMDFDMEAVRERLETPKDASMGDVAFPCFLLSKALRNAPPKIAQDLAPKCVALAQSHPEIEKIEAAGPYVNFFVSSEALSKVVLEILEGDGLSPRPSRGERVMIEYSQPNTHKAFHVGHMRNVALGDALVRLYEQAGYEVTAANYIGDEGTHIAKCLWAYQKSDTSSLPQKDLGEYLGGFYRQADEWLDFDRLTEYPFPGVVCAEVLSIAPHPEEEKWRVVRLATSSGEETVVCGGQGFDVGQKVAYVPVGERFAGRAIVEKDMKGVLSRGMICGEKELKVSQDKSQIFILDEETPVGKALTEIGRRPEALAASSEVAEEMATREREVSETLKALEDKSSPIQSLWQTTRQWSLDDFREIYRWIDCRFDHYFYESEVGDAGKQLVLDARSKGLLVESEGTVGADLSEDKLGYLMLLKSDGTGLYATKDIALAQQKFEAFNIDRSIYVVDSSQSLHFQQVFKTLEKLGYRQAAQCFHLAYGLVTVPEGKMSSRKGTVIYFSKLRDTLTDHIRKEQLAKHEGDWSEDELAEAAKRVAVATIKYGMLNQDNLKNIVFDMEAWTSLTGNTGPYLMYAYARTCSIRRKVGDLKLSQFNGERLTHVDEKAVLTALNQFSKTVDRCIEQNKPQNMCMYLYQLCRSFSRMFENCPVARAEDEELKMTRLALVQATGEVLKKGLSLIGITVLERM